MDPILKHAPQMVRDAIQSMDYAAIDQEAIRKMDNKDFAKWQADRSDSLHHQLFANQEWSQRLLEKQLRSQRWLAILGVVGTLAGVALGFFLERGATPNEQGSTPKMHQQANIPMQTKPSPAIPTTTTPP